MPLRPTPTPNRSVLRSRPVLACAAGVLTLALAGCGSSVSYTCVNKICTANGATANVQLSAVAYTAKQQATEAPVTVAVTRSGEGDGAVTVHYATSDLSGTAGVDYVPAAGTLSWAAGDRSPKSVQVFLKHQAMRRPSQTFSISLSAPSEGASLGTASSAVVTVEGDDQEPAHTLPR